MRSNHTSLGKPWEKLPWLKNRLIHVGDSCSIKEHREITEYCCLAGVWFSQPTANYQLQPQANSVSNTAGQVASGASDSTVHWWSYNTNIKDKQSFSTTRKQKSWTFKATTPVLQVWIQFIIINKFTLFMTRLFPMVFCLLLIVFSLS